MNFLDLLDRSDSSVVLPDATVTTAIEIATIGRRYAHKWTADGLHVGDRVALWLPNGASYLHHLAACAAGRFVAVSVNTRFSALEAERLIARSGAKLVFDASSKVGALPTDTRNRNRSNLEGSTPDDPFVVFTTSGTTSQPKMVLHTQRSIAAHGFDAANALSYTAEDVSLLAMPFCGTFGLASLAAALASNATIIVEDHFDVTRTAEKIRKHRVSVVNGSDDMFHRLLDAGADLSSIRLGGYARFNTSLDGIVERTERSGARLTGLYGMSEVQALFAVRDAHGTFQERSLAGGTLVSPSADFRIEDGELWLKGPSLFSGYLAEGGHAIDNSLTNAAFTDGWFRTGDVAEGPAISAVENRTFTYVSRMGDALRLGGFLVAPSEIEQKLLEVPGVLAAVVVSVDLQNGTRPVAFVIAPGGVNETAAIEHCSRNLARFKVPVRIFLIDEFPTTQSANGTKIQNAKLRERALSALSAD